MTNILIPIEEFQTAIPSNFELLTERSTNTTSPSNNDLLDIYGLSTVSALPELFYSQGTCFDNMNQEYRITTKEDLFIYLCDILIRFDASPPHYQKEDYEALIKMLIGSLIYLYEQSPIDPTTMNAEVPLYKPNSTTLGLQYDPNTLAVVDSKLTIIREDKVSVFSAANETELLTTWELARASNRNAIIYITGPIYLTADRNFVVPYGDPWIQLEGTPSQLISSQFFRFNFGQVYFKNIIFKTDSTSYLWCYGGYAKFADVTFADEVAYNAAMKTHINIYGVVTGGTGQIILDGVQHQSSTDVVLNNSGDIQPIIINSTVSFTNALYVTIKNVVALSSFDRFSRVLLMASASTIYKVSGDSSWYYRTTQEMPGQGYIAATSSILKSGAFDDLRATFIPNNTDVLVKVLGVSNDKLVRLFDMPAVSVDPVDAILHWDGTKYVPYAEKKSIQPNYPYFYAGTFNVVAPSINAYLLYLEATLAASSYTILDSTLLEVTQIRRNYIQLNYDPTKGIILTSTNTEASIKSNGPISLILGGTVNTERIKVDSPNYLFEIDMTNIKLTKGTASKYYGTDTNKNLVPMTDPDIFWKKIGGNVSLRSAGDALSLNSDAFNALSVEAIGIPIAIIGSNTSLDTSQTITSIFRKISVGNPTTGFGSNILFTNPNYLIVDKESGKISNIWTDSTSGVETSSFEWWLSNVGTFAKKMELSGAGKLIIGGLNLSAGTPNKYLYLDADNNVIFVDGTGGTGGMIYPSSGIAVSNGSGWVSSLSDNSIDWNTAFDWGNHANLYTSKNFPIDINRSGFLNQSETILSFDPVTKIFTLGSVGATWSYYRLGIKYTITGSKTINLTSLDPVLIDGAKYFISIDSTDGTLSVSKTTWTLLDSLLPVAIVAWNDTLTPKYFLQEERHSCLIDRREHYYLHTTRGTQYLSGGELLGYTLSTTTDAANTFSIGQTVIMDEDIIETLPIKADGNGADSTNYIVLYRNPIGTYVWKYSDMPFSYTTNGYIDWDNNGILTQGTGGAGVSVRYYNTYVIYTNTQGDGRYVIVVGQAQHTTLQAAYDEIFANFDLLGFPKSEWLALYQLTWVTGLDSLTNKGKIYLAREPERITTSVITASQITAIPHNSLSGLQGGSEILSEFYHLTAAQLATYEAQVPIVYASSHHLSTGLLTGGALSINVDNTKFDITAGKGYVVDGHTNPEYPIVTEVIWTQKLAVAITNINVHIATYISLDASGNVIQSPSPPDATSRRHYIYLGTIVHSNLATINAINNQPTIVLELGAQVQDLMNSLGFRSTSGNRIRPVATNLQIEKDIGTAFKPGANFQTLNTQPHEFTLAAQNPITFRYRTQTGIETADMLDINPTIYDLNGTLTTVPLPNNATIQRVFIFPSGLIRIQPGQMVFTSLTEAINTVGNEDFILESNITQNGLYLGSIAVIKAATNLSLNTEAIFIPASGVATTGSISNLTNLQQAFDISTIPQIITGTGTHQSLTIRRGSAIDTDTVFAIQNGAGINTLTILGSGSITASSYIVPTGTAAQFLKANGSLDSSTYAYINHSQADSTITFTDNIIGNASITAHGYLPKLLGGTDSFLRADGTWATPVWLVNPMTAVGDIIIGGVGGVATKLAATTDTYVLTLSAGAPIWKVAAPVDALGNLNIPITTTTLGFIKQNNVPIFHTFGNINLFIGVSSGNTTLTTAQQNTMIGYQAGSSITTTSYNTAVGYQALLQATSAQGDNCALGRMSLMYASGSYNCGLGNTSLAGLTFSGSYNVGIGKDAGRTLSTGSHNTYIGYLAGYHASQLATATYSMALGDQAYTTKSYQVVLGADNITETLLKGFVGIGKTPLTTLDVNGIIAATGGSSTNWNTAYSWGNHANLYSPKALVEYISFEFRDIVAGTIQTYDLDIKASYGYTIESAVLETDNGTLIGVAIKIGATSVTSLSNLLVDTVADETASIGAKTVVAGNRITIVTTAGFSGTPTILRGKINIIRT